MRWSDMSTIELLQLYESARQVINSDCYGVSDISIIAGVEAELKRRAKSVVDEAKALIHEVKAGIEQEFYRILDTQPHEMAVNKAFELMLEASALAEGYYTQDDIVLAAREFLRQAVEAWVETQIQGGRMSDSSNGCSSY